MSEITQHEYWAEVASLATSITTEAKQQDREIGDVLHETIDGHQWVIYTAHAMRVLCLSPNDGYSVDNFGVESVVKDGALDWSALAFGALYADVSEHSEFDAEPEDDDESNI